MKNKAVLAVIDKIVKEINDAGIKFSYKVGDMGEMEYYLDNTPIKKVYRGSLQADNLGNCGIKQIKIEYMWYKISDYLNELIPRPSQQPGALLSPYILALFAYFFIKKNNISYLVIFNHGMRTKKMEGDSLSFFIEFIRVLIKYGEIIHIAPSYLNPVYVGPGSEGLSLAGRHLTTVVLWYTKPGLIADTGYTFNLKDINLDYGISLKEVAEKLHIVNRLDLDGLSNS